MVKFDTLFFLVYTSPDIQNIVIMAEYKYCRRHPEYRNYNRTDHGTCFYCILDGVEQYEEAHNTLVNLMVRGSNITTFGYLDAFMGLVYKPPTLTNTPFTTTKVNPLYNIYMSGVKMYKQELVEQPKHKSHIFPEGYNLEKYERLKEKLKEMFAMIEKEDAELENLLPPDRKDDDTDTDSQNSNGFNDDYVSDESSEEEYNDYKVDIDTLEIINLKDAPESGPPHIFSKKTNGSGGSKDLYDLRVLYNMLYEDKIVE